MRRETTRRAALGGALAAGVAGGFLSPVAPLLRRFAPLSGSVWDSARGDRRSTVESPHGPAEVRYDDAGVPHISADDETALYFAAGHVQATDRLFQLDLQRRLVSGTLAAVVGDAALESDRFNRKMRFREAAEATADHVRDTPAGPTAGAYVDGVNAAIEGESLPVEFRLLGYEPEPWTLTDSMLVEKLVAWGLTGTFRTLRKALVTDEFGAEMADQLYPDRFDETTPIVRDQHGTATFGAGLDIEPVARAATPAPDARDVDGRDGGPGPGLVDWLLRFEPSRHLGSNSWLVGPELAPGDAPLVCNDPHLSLQAPPVWYEMHLDGPEHRVRGVSFPGVPYVVIGENDHGAWGFTNAGADVIDFYTYDEREGGEAYRYGDETRAFETRTEEIEVDGGANETVELKRSVHGPVLTEAGQEVGVAWTGHAATETTLAIYQLTHSTGAEEARAAVGRFESPTQNVVYGATDGDRWYHMAGRVPVRRTDGDVVRGDRVFDGSAREGEWRGFEPFTRPSAWERDESEDEGGPDFVPFEAHPHVDDPAYLATANQRIVPDDRLAYYLGVEYAPRYRGERIYALLDERVASDDPLDPSFLRTVGRDTRDGRATALVGALVAAARQADDDALADAADTLASWDRRMDPDSEGALLFDRWLSHYRDELFEMAFEDIDGDGDPAAYYPSDGAIEQLPPDSPWFGPRQRPRAMRAALRTTVEAVEREGHETYGDISHTGRIGHPLELDFLAYPAHPRGGSGSTVQNFAQDAPSGGSWEMQVDLDGEYRAILPGGNSGRYVSPHYDDQIARWAAGEYRTLSREPEGDLTVTFEEGTS